tara:strand:+ start:250 stop:519 length:270 start_codon:yes stop_codon:yes gene_type:complete
MSIKIKKSEPILSDKPKRVYRKRKVELMESNQVIDPAKMDEKINEIVEELDNNKPSSVELENNSILIRYPLLNNLEHEELKKKILALFS